MSYLPINTGTYPGDGAGDAIKVGLDKVNANFAELYSRLGEIAPLVEYDGPFDMLKAATQINANFTYLFSRLPK